jgi:hypothetical protein
MMMSYHIFDVDVFESFELWERGKETKEELAVIWIIQEIKDKIELFYFLFNSISAVRLECEKFKIFLNRSSCSVLIVLRHYLKKENL